MIYFTRVLVDPKLGMLCRIDNNSESLEVICWEILLFSWVASMLHGEKLLGP